MPTMNCFVSLAIVAMQKSRLFQRANLTDRYINLTDL